jgi:hypothetical protein
MGKGVNLVRRIRQKTEVLGIRPAKPKNSAAVRTKREPAQAAGIPAMLGLKYIAVV